MLANLSESKHTILIHDRVQAGSKSGGSDSYFDICRGCDAIFGNRNL